MKRFVTHPFALIFFTALVVRLIYLAECTRQPAFMIPTIDAATYHTFASQWVMDGMRDSTTAWHSAFYPLFLTMVYKVFGVSILAAKMIQMILGALTCAGIGSVARHLFGKRAGWIAGLGAAFYGPVIFYESELVSAGWSVAWSTLLLAQCCIKPRARPVTNGAMSGVLAAGAALIRPELFAGYTGSLVVIHIFTALKKEASWRPDLRSFLTGVAVFFLLTIPAGLLNQRFTGHLTWLPANSGLNLYIGNSLDPCETLTARPGPDYDRIVNVPKRSGLFSADKQNDFFREQVLSIASSRPLLMLRHFAWKAWLLVSSREITADLDVYTAREPSFLLRALVWKTGTFGFPFGLIFPAAMLIGLHPKRRVLKNAGALFLIAAFVMIMYHPSARYRLIFLPMLLVMAGGGVSAFIDTLQENAERRRTMIIAFAVVTFFATALHPLTCLEETDFKAERYRMIGQRLLPVSKDAVSWLEKSRQRNSHEPQVHFLFGLHAWELGDTDSANQNLDRALTLAPDYVMALMLKAEIEEKQGRLKSTQALLLRAVESAPDHAEALYRLAMIEARMNNFRRALYHMEQSLRFDSRDARRHLDLAAILLELGRAGDALVLYEQLLSVFPDEPNLHINMALTCKELDQHSRAEQHFAEALRLSGDDPELRVWIEKQLNASGKTTP